MRRAVLMTRQAISPRLAIRFRLNIFLTAAFGRDPEPQTGTQGRNNSVVQQNQTEATAYMPKLPLPGSIFPRRSVRLRSAAASPILALACAFHAAARTGFS